MIMGRRKNRYMPEIKTEFEDNLIQLEENIELGTKR